MTRQRLQTISKEFEEAQTQKFVNILVENVKHAILVKAYNDSPNKTPSGGAISVHHRNHDKPKMLKLDLPLQLSGTVYDLPNQERLVYTPPYNKWNSYLPVILERLQELFPDVAFQVDPLKTYLLIDWS